MRRDATADEDGDEGWTLRKRESPSGNVSCAHLLVFTPDGKVLVAVGVNGHVNVIDLESWEVMESLKQHLPKPSAAAVALDKAARKERRGAEAKGDAKTEPVSACDVGCPAVSHACASADGQWLAVVTTSSGRSGRREAGVHVYNLDALKLHASLPPPPGNAAWPPVAAVAFGADGVLALALRDNAIVAYDAERAKVTPWSAALAEAGISAPPTLASLPGQICGLSFDPAPGSSVLLAQTPSAIARVDLASRPDSGGKDGKQMQHSNGAPSPKRRRKSGKGGDAVDAASMNGSGGAGAVKTASLDDPCLFLGYFAPGRALLVERPWKEVLKQIPEPLYRHRFGT